MIIPETQLTNVDATLICRSYGIDLKTIMKNELPNNPALGFYLVNLNSTGQSGSHWTLLIIKKDYCFWFDSFACPPANEIMSRLLPRFRGKIFFNNKIIQDLKSILCGYFCISLLIIINDKKKKFDMLDIVEKYNNYFADNTKLNNERLRTLMENY